MSTMTEWPLTWEPMTLRVLGGKRRGLTRPVDVPYRRCPHGGYWFDEAIAPPRLLDAWGFDGMPSCDDAECIAAYQANRAA